MSEEPLNVEIRMGDLHATFSGKPSDVYETVDRFLSQNISEISFARQIYLNYSLKELVEMFREFVKITEEGPRVISERPLSLKLKISLQLIACKIAFMLNRIQRAGYSVQELEESMATNAKSISSRLSELVKEGYVMRSNDEKGSSYYVTTAGIKWVFDALHNALK
ncbi:MAG: hypothetical protein JRN37_01430 [Nitrososphaerota archaeon]|nr:hypothetical protein [Nitrososphaerota archaeon]MDG7043283.1 hypothetical protein [Nitrososphaerota archaeon]